jgi:hypothetical protein
MKIILNDGELNPEMMQKKIFTLRNRSYILDNIVFVAEEMLVTSKGLK